MAYNPTFDLRGKRIDNTYPQIAQYDSASNLSYNGIGNTLAFTSSYSSLAATSILTEGFPIILPTNTNLMNIVGHIQGYSNIYQSAVMIDNSSNVYGNLVGTASYSSTSSYALNGGGGTTATSSWASQSLTSSYLQLYDAGLGRYVTLTSYNGVLSVQ